MFSSITGILKVSHISTSYEPKRICYLPSAQIMKVVDGGDEGDRWRCRRLFYAVSLKTQNTCCRMNLCLSHVF